MQEAISPFPSSKLTPNVPEAIWGWEQHLWKHEPPHLPTSSDTYRAFHCCLDLKCIYSGMLIQHMWHSLIKASKDLPNCLPWESWYKKHFLLQFTAAPMTEKPLAGHHSSDPHSLSGHHGWRVHGDISETDFSGTCNSQCLQSSTAKILYQIYRLVPAGSERKKMTKARY